MGKGLILSFAASAVMLGGGQIVPVKSVAKLPKTECNDFYGFVGVGAIYHDVKTDHTTLAAFSVIGVRRKITSGFTANIEIQAASLAFHDGTDITRYAIDGRSLEQNSLTQLNIESRWGKTTIKTGRFALTGKRSPLIATPGSYFGLKTFTFDGVLVTNKGISNTTVWGAHLYNKIVHPTSGWSGFRNVKKPSIGSSTVSRFNYVAGGLISTALPNTTITMAGYYGLDDKNHFIVGSLDKKWCDTLISMGGAYQYIKAKDTGYYIGGILLTQRFGHSDIKIGVTYGDVEYKKYTDFTAHNGYAFRKGTNTWAVGAKASTSVAGYRLFLQGDYQEMDTWEVLTGVGKTFAGIDVVVDYLHNSVDANRLRTKILYKF